ncbi:aminotransferase class I/II-fold pyridoxal phosphate-dependent enzyme [Secundilactobacillus collinoides]|nr:aminotransferase class I/II-fold pyridoxal phosphate-dependent enzyme [Secundilactobacillus collinoides]
MTGWRLGFVFGPSGVIDLIAKCHQYQVTAATSIVQYAAIEAMTNGEEDAEAMRVIYEKRCNYLRTALGKLGLDIVKPQGAFYVFVSLPDAWKDDSMAFAKKLAKEQHVGVIPGAPFGDDHAIRISYAASDESIHAAVAGLKAVLEDIGAVPVE